MRKNYLIAFLIIAHFCIAQTLDTNKTMWIECSYPQSWDRGTFFHSELEKTWNGYQDWQVVTTTMKKEYLKHARSFPENASFSDQQLFSQQYPYAIRLDVKIESPQIKAERTPVLFFWGRRRLDMDVWFQMQSKWDSLPKIEGRLNLDTVVSAGYCGFLECVVEPWSIQQRLEYEKALFQKLLKTLKDRIRQAWIIPYENLPVTESKQKTSAASSQSSQ